MTPLNSMEPKPRDLVWSAVLNRVSPGYTRVTVEQVHRELKLREGVEAPHRETVRRTMHAMAELGVLKHRDGSPNWRFVDEQTLEVLE